MPDLLETLAQIESGEPVSDYRIGPQTTDRPVHQKVDWWRHGKALKPEIRRAFFEAIRSDALDDETRDNLYWAMVWYEGFVQYERDHSSA